MRKTIAQYLRDRQDIDFRDDLVLIGPGSKELIFQSLFVFEGPVIIPAPSWVSYKPQVDIKRSPSIIYKTLREHKYKIQPDRFQEFCDSLGNGQKIIIMNNPSNPTGSLYDEAEVKALSEIFRKNKCYLHLR